MKKLSLFLVLLFALMIIHKPAAAQEDGYRVFGVGVNVLDLSGLFSGQGSTIYLPINLGPSFRLEPSLGFSSMSYDNEGDADDSETSFQFGLGILPTIRRGNSVIYIGGRIGLSFGSEEEKNSGGDVYVEYSTFTFGLGPVVGGEYYFNPHISLGGEAGILYGNTTQKTDSKSDFIDDTERTVSGFGTSSMIFIRFYF